MSRRLRILFDEQCNTLMTMTSGLTTFKSKSFRRFPYRQYGSCNVEGRNMGLFIEAGKLACPSQVSCTD